MSPEPMSTAWERLANKYGIPAVISLFLIWWLTKGVSGDIGDIKASLGRHMYETNFYLRQVCLNTASSESQRAACISLDGR